MKLRVLGGIGLCPAACAEKRFNVVHRRAMGPVRSQRDIIILYMRLQVRPTLVPLWENLGYHAMRRIIHGPKEPTKREGMVCLFCFIVQRALP